MKVVTLSFLTWSVSLVSTRSLKQNADQLVINIPTNEFKPQYLLEFADGETKWVTEAEKWQLKRDGQFFIDTTNYQDLGNCRTQSTRHTKFPASIHQKSKINSLLKDLNKTNIKTHLEHLTSFHNRWYDSTYGEASYHWLLSTIMTTIASTGAHKQGIKAEPFIHPWGQNSIIVRIAGQSSSTIVVGAHQDSVNHEDPTNGRAPGADDDGSGTVTILEARNTIEFHWYAGEEGGFLGSQAVFLGYARTRKDVKAMLEQDMTGFYNSTIEEKKEFGLMMDYVDKLLLQYIKLIIEEYTDIGWVETSCGRCGSDHMSAIKAGYPGIYVLEAPFDKSDNHLHGEDDLIEYLDYDHMVDHARMTLGFLYELAFAKL